MGPNKHTVYLSKDNKKFKFYDEKRYMTGKRGKEWGGGVRGGEVGVRGGEVG